MNTLPLADTTQENTPALATVACFFEALNQADIRYCHWKSNVRLTDALQGRTDLDLLIDPAHQAAFEAILQEWAIKRVQAAPGREYPGLEHYLGFDETSGRMFHLHVHYQLVLGEQFVKNYHLPLETPFLDDTQLRHGVKVPFPELELTVLALRALLKYRDRDALKGLLPWRAPALPGHIRQEIAWLTAQTTPQRMTATLRALDGILPTQEIQLFLQAMQGKTGVGYTLLRLRNRVRQALQAYQRDSRTQAWWRYQAESWRRRKWFIRAGSQRKMSFPRGGLQLAFVGVDGAGKSTAVEQITRWLSWRLTVRPHYMGHSRPSPGPKVVQTIAKTMQRIAAANQQLLGSANILTRQIHTWQQQWQALRYVAEARDRWQRYRTGAREADSGCIVIYDRYPLPTVQLLNHAMDGPHLASPNGHHHTPLVRQLAHQEAAYYRQIKPPDALFVLHITPEVALRRKPEHKPHLMTAKSMALDNFDVQGTCVIKIEAEKPLEQVLLEIKCAVWRML